MVGEQRLLSHLQHEKNQKLPAFLVSSVPFVPGELETITVALCCSMCGHALLGTPRTSYAKAGPEKIMLVGSRQVLLLQNAFMLSVVVPPKPVAIAAGPRTLKTQPLED